MEDLTGKKKIFNFIPKTMFYIIIAFVIAALSLIIIAFFYLKGNETTGTKPKEDSVIVGMKAVNDKIYGLDDTIAPEDFEVFLVYDDESTEKLTEDAYVLSSDQVTAYGESSQIDISLVSDPEISVKAFVKNKREELPEYRFEVGMPNREDVVAQLYSNGELCFSGSGDTIQFSKGSFPWQRVSSKVKITAVTFEESVRPNNLNGWFSGMKYLTYCGPIPDSVQSMRNTFSNCISLEAMADWSQCTGLADVTECYSGCTNLQTTYPLPSSVKKASELCAKCSNLIYPVELSNALSCDTAEGMFRDCISLIDVSIPPNVVDMSNMYSGCINIKQAPELPNSVRNMSNAFYNCSSLVKAVNVPSNVEDLSGAFSGCGLLTGTLRIDATPSYYHSVFNNSCNATELLLIGNSQNMDLIVGNNTSVKNMQNNKNTESETKADTETKAAIKNKQEKETVSQ